MRMSKKGGIDWNAKGPDRIAQNVRNLLSLTQYEAAYNRLLGLPAGAIDAPVRRQRQRLPRRPGR